LINSNSVGKLEYRDGLSVPETLYNGETLVVGKKIPGMPLAQPDFFAKCRQANPYNGEDEEEDLCPRCHPST
jgi:hypothetical protein